MGDSLGEHGHLGADDRDGRAAGRDDADGHRDSQATERDLAATDRDSRAMRRDWAQRDYLNATMLRRAAVLKSRSLAESAMDADAQYEQAVIDRESTVSELEMLEQDMFEALTSARQGRRDAAHDRWASRDDRLNAEEGRRAAAEDRTAAARDRDAASAERQQDEISQNLATLPPRKEPRA
jgi:hypothetical protein